jgi:alpha/beta superfamily hydrolase
MQKLKRTINVGFRVTEEEKQMILRRQAQTNITNLRAYLLKMAVDGRVINLELSTVNECSKLLRNVSSNINQIAKWVNETSHIYAADLDDIQVQLDAVWKQQNTIIKSLTKVLEVV